MPPKGWAKDESDEDESSTTEESTSTETSSEESEEDDFAPAKSEAIKPAPKPAPKTATGVVANRPHDEEFDADPAPTGAAVAPAKAAPGKAAPAPMTRPGGAIANRPHDEEFAADEGHRKTPPGRGNAPGGAAGGRPPAAGARGTIQNDHADEFEDVEDDVDDQPTPPKGAAAAAAGQSRPTGAAANGPGQGRPPAGGIPPRQVSNQPHDEEFNADNRSVGSPSSTAASMSPPSSKAAPLGSVGKAPAGKMSMRPQSDDESSSESDDDDDGSHNNSSNQNAMGGGGGYHGTSVPAGATAQPLGVAQHSVAVIPEYNPADYAHIVKKQTAEIRDLFNHITAYQPQVVECPTKLRPFIPDLLPCVGDIDTFCKVPRPDGKPDNFGLTVVDEPSSNQSNPAVVKMSLIPFSKVSSSVTFVDSVEDAQNRPKVIDKWIADIKSLQHKKPLPTVTYSKPMPDIERLMQAWPPEFEELLNSDVALPPPTIDLDMYQYVKLLCGILDIPTYNNPIESLHVMFTLYLEFRANQHFQHA